MQQRVWIPVVVLALVVGLYTQWHDIQFYWNLYRANQTGQQFYATYPYLTADISFHPDFDVALDVYGFSPGEAKPVLIFVHGGGWQDYDKKLFAPVALKMVEQDIVTVIPDYTLHPDADYRQMSQEVAAAVAWTLENIDRYGGDPARVVLAGHSAGGHLAGLVALDDVWLNGFGHSAEELCGWIGLSGVYDADRQLAFEQAKGGTAPVMTAVMGGQDNFAAASPITYARPGAPRTLLIHGERDTTVPVAMSQALQDVLVAEGAASDLVVYPEAGHTDYLFAGLTDPASPLPADIGRFVTGCVGDVG